MSWAPFSVLTSKIYGALALAAIAGCGVQQFRIVTRDVTIAGQAKTISDKQATIDAMIDAQKLAAAKAAAARLEQEKIYSSIAKRIDDNATKQMGGALGAAERFIAAGGLWPEADRSSLGRAGTGAGDRGARDPRGTGPTAELDGARAAVAPDLAALGLVAVRAEDVRICTANTVKAEAAHRWAIGLGEANRRDP